MMETLIVAMLLNLLGVVKSKTAAECRQQGPITGIFSSNYTYHNHALTEAYHVYTTSRPLTWCQGHRACQGQDQSLLSIKRPEDQDVLETIQRTLGRSGFIWLGARRKDYGSNWTWTNENLTDCDPGVCGKLSGNIPFASLFQTPFEPRLKNDHNRILARLNCKDTTVTDTWNDVQGRHEASTWYEGQNTCSSAGGRLLGLHEYNSSLPTGVYWMGLFYRPWLWLGDTSDEDRPVTYFQSNLTFDLKDERNCLGVRLSNLSWTPVNCDQYTTVLVCQGPLDKTTSTQQFSGTLPDDSMISDDATAIFDDVTHDNTEYDDDVTKSTPRSDDVSSADQTAYLYITPTKQVSEAATTESPDEFDIDVKTLFYLVVTAAACLLVCGLVYGTRAITKTWRRRRETGRRATAHGIWGIPPQGECLDSRPCQTTSALQSCGVSLSPDATRQNHEGSVYDVLRESLVQHIGQSQINVVLGERGSVETTNSNVMMTNSCYDVIQESQIRSEIPKCGYDFRSTPRGVSPRKPMPAPRPSIARRHYGNLLYESKSCSDLQSCSTQRSVMTDKDVPQVESASPGDQLVAEGEEYLITCPPNRATMLWKSQSVNDL